MYKFIILLIFFLIPVSALAQTVGAKGIIEDAGMLVSMLIPISASLALVYFFWGLSKFILKAGDESGREEGKQVMMWGIVALFVLVSIWGIVAFLRSELGLSEIWNL